MDDFNQFYKAYPRKESKGRAYDTWIKLKKKGILPDVSVIVKALEARTKANAWPEKEFIKHPATWLNAWGWEDEIDTIAKEAWHESASGIEQKGAELGLHPSQFANWQLFRTAVLQKSIKAA